MTVDESAVRAACESLCARYAASADASHADDFAALFAADGVFDRMGQALVGREAIRQVIAGRPAGTWTRHRYRNLRIVVAPDGRSATGTSDLELERGRAGESQVEHLRGTYTDVYRLTDDGWRFGRRAFRFIDD